MGCKTVIKPSILYKNSNFCIKYLVLLGDVEVRAIVDRKTPATLATSRRKRVSFAVVLTSSPTSG